MTYQNLGNGVAWEIDDGKTVNDEQQTTRMDALNLLSGKALNLLEQVAACYTDDKQTESLDALQSCTHEIFKHCAERLDAGKKYGKSVTADLIDDDIN